MKKMIMSGGWCLLAKRNRLYMALAFVGVSVVSFFLAHVSAQVSTVPRSEDLDALMAAQPALIAAAGASRSVVAFSDPSAAPNSQIVVSGLPSNANPQGAVYYGPDNGLIADAGNSRIFVVQVSNGALIDTINMAAAGFNGSGTIAVSPDQTTALVMGSPLVTPSNTLYIIHGPFSSSSPITSVTLPGVLGSFQTQAIVFNTAGRAFVYTTAGISALDAPYTSVAFTFPFSNPNSGALAITPNGNTLLFTDIVSNNVGIIQAPFSAASTFTMLSIPGGVGMDGIMVTPDGASAIVVSNGAHQASGIAAPFSTASVVSNIPLPAGFDQFEDVGISADSQLAILTGGSILEPAVLVRAPFNSAAVTSTLTISGANGARGRGSVRFRPAAAASSVSLTGRVTTPEGAGLKNAVVTLIDQNNVARRATTSTFGFYSFDNVLTGSNYTITVTSKRYRFTSRAVQVSTATSGIDFTGQE